MEKLYFAKDLNGLDAIKTVKENLKLNRSCELYYGDTYVSYSYESDKFDITCTKISIDNVTNDNWCVRITDFEVEESDMIDLKDLSLIELKKEIARLANKYDLDYVIWNCFNINNTDTEARYSFAIAFADYREYSYNDISILSECGDKFSGDFTDDENLNDYEKNSTRWSIKYDKVFDIKRRIEERKLLKNLTFEEVKSTVVKSVDNEKKFDVFYGHESVTCYMKKDNLVIADEFDSDIYDRNSKEWSVRILDKSISDKDKLNVDSLSLSDLKEFISKLANKYILQLLWDKFKITNEDAELKNNEYSFVILHSEGEDYKPSYVEIENDSKTDSSDYIKYNLSNKELESNSWKLEYIE